MSISLEKRHRDYISRVIEQYDLSFFAFGSRVNGKSKKYSDLDLFYFEPLSNRDRMSLEESFEDSDLPFTIDLLNFNTCDKDFQKILLKNHALLKHSSRLIQIERNHFYHFTYFPQKRGLPIDVMDGVTLVHSGLNSSMFNIAYGSPQQQHNSQEGFIQSINRIKASFSGQPFAWWIPPSHHNDVFTQALIAEDFLTQGCEYAMFCDLKNGSHLIEKTSLDIHPVKNLPMLQDFLHILEQYDPLGAQFYRHKPEDFFNTKESLMVGYMNGQPLSIGIVCVHEKSAGIFSLITQDDAQGKGYGTDMMIFLMKYAKNHGCDSVTLSASSELGYRIYEKLGFCKAGVFECFEYRSVLNETD